MERRMRPREISYLSPPPLPHNSPAIVLGEGGGMGDERRNTYEFSGVGDLLFDYAKFLLRPFLQRDRHRAKEKTRLRTIDVLNTEFVSGLPFEGAISVFGDGRVDFVSWRHQGKDRP